MPLMKLFYREAGYVADNPTYAQAMKLVQIFFYGLNGPNDNNYFGMNFYELKVCISNACLPLIFSGIHKSGKHFFLNCSASLRLCRVRGTWCRRCSWN